MSWSDICTPILPRKQAYSTVQYTRLTNPRKGRKISFDGPDLRWVGYCMGFDDREDHGSFLVAPILLWNDRVRCCVMGFDRISILSPLVQERQAPLQDNL